MDDDDLVRSSMELWFYFLGLGKVISKDLETRLADRGTGISNLQYGILAFLSQAQAQAQELTASQISRSMGMAPATLVPAVDSLEKKGLLQRTADPNDRRRNPLILTKEGKDLVNSVPFIDKSDSIIKVMASMDGKVVQKFLTMNRDFIERFTSVTGVPVMDAKMKERIQTWSKPGFVGTDSKEGPSGN